MISQNKFTSLSHKGGLPGSQPGAKWANPTLAVPLGAALWKVLPGLWWVVIVRHHRTFVREIPTALHIVDGWTVGVQAHWPGWGKTELFIWFVRVGVFVGMCICVCGLGRDDFRFFWNFITAFQILPCVIETRRYGYIRDSGGCV